MTSDNVSPNKPKYLNPRNIPPGMTSPIPKKATNELVQPHNSIILKSLRLSLIPSPKRNRNTSMSTKVSKLFSLISSIIKGQWKTRDISKTNR